MAENVIQTIGIKTTADTGDTVKKLNDLSNGLKKVYDSAKGIDTKGMSFGQLRQGLQQAQASLRSAEKNVVKYGNTMGQMWRNAKVDEADAKGRVDAYTQALAKLEKQASGMKISIWNEGTPTSSEKYPFGKEEEYTPTQYKFAPIDPKLLGGQELDETNAKGQETVGVFSRVKAKIKEAFSEESLQNFSNKMKSISAKAGSISEKMGGVAKTVGNAGRSFLSAINPIKMFRNEENKLSLSSTLLGKAFSRLGRMFRIMVTRMLIRGFISNIREGFQNIAQYSDVVNQKFSAIISSAKTLYNAFASALTPIIEAVAPAVVKVLDFLTSAMNKVAEFMSALTGKSYFIKATKYQYDYAKSLNQSTKATNKNTKATDKNKKKKKELKDAQIGIDRLNVISPDKDKATKSNGGNNNGAGNNGGVKPSDMFDTKPVSKKMKDLAKEVKKIAKKLFDPIKKAWDKKGKRVIGSFKTMLGSIWETVKAIGRDFLKMWGQKKTQKIFEDILETVALIFDTVTAISDQFRKAWTKDNVGLHIFENIRDVVGIIVSGIKDCAKYTKRWASRLNFFPLLKSIEKYTKSLKKLMEGLVGIGKDFYKIVVLGISKWIIEKGLPKLIQVFTDFNNKVDWQSLRKSLREVWKGVEKFGEAVGEGLIDFIGWLADGIKDLLNSKWFKGFLEGIGKALSKIKPSGVTTALKLFFKVWAGAKVIKGVTSLFGKVGEKIGWVAGKIKWFKYSTVGSKIVGAFSGIGKKVGKKLSGLGSKISEALSNAKTTATEKASNLGSKIGKALGMSAGEMFGAVTLGLIVVSLAEMVSEIEMQTDEAEHLNEKEQDYLNKLDKEYTKHENNLNAVKEQNSETLNLRNKATDYKNDLDKIVGKNGKIKKGHEAQAKFLVGKLNTALGDNMKIVDGQVKGYKRGVKYLKDQLDLVAQKQLLEQGAGQYYDNQSILENGSSKLEKTKKIIEKLGGSSIKDILRAGRNGGGLAGGFDALKNAFNFWKDNADMKKALKKYKKQLKSMREAYRYNIRYEALQNAKGKKQREKALKNMNKALTKQEKKTFDVIHSVALEYNKSIPEVITKNKSFEEAIKKAGLKGKKISTKLREGVLSGKIDVKDAVNYQKLYEQAKEKSPKVAEEIAKGIKGNKKSVKEAIKELQFIVNNIKGKDVKVGADTSKAKKDVKKWKPKGKTLNINGKVNGKGIKKKIRSKIPSSIDVKVRAVLDRGSVSRAGKEARVLAEIQSQGGKLKKRVRGADGHMYAYYELDGKTRKKKLYASGGFPKLGSEFIAGEKGAEFVGTINGKTGVASNQEITGIRDSIVETSNAQIQMLNEQNNLLRGILAKNTNIVLDGEKVTKSVNRINNKKGYRMATT